MNPRRFKQYTPRSKRVKYNTPDTLSWSRLPIYILPDVLLNDAMTETFAEKIYETIHDNGKGPANIYTYNSKGVESEKLSSWDLTTHVSHLVQDIMHEQKNSPLPIILTGYSSGSTLAAEIAIELQKRGLSSKVFLLDAPARSMLRTFADSQLGTNSYNEFKMELAALVEYAARFSGYIAKLKQQGLSEETLAALSNSDTLRLLGLNTEELDISSIMRTDRFTLFFNNIIDQVSRIAPNDKLEEALQKKFITLLMIGKRMVINEVSQEPKDRPKLPEVYTIFTQETAKKFGATTDDKIATFTGGWENNANQVIALNTPKDQLGLAKHSALLNKDNAALIAQLMYKTLNQDSTLTAEALHSLQTKASYTQVKNNPDVDAEAILEADLANMLQFAGKEKVEAAFARLFTRFRPAASVSLEEESSAEASPLGTSPVADTEAISLSK